MRISVKQVIKYVLEGLAISVGAYALKPNGRRDLKTIVTLGVTAALTFLVLDLFAPAVGLHTRTGTGFRLGFGMVGGDGEASADANTDAGASANADVPPEITMKDFLALERMISYAEKNDGFLEEACLADLKQKHAVLKDNVRSRTETFRDTLRAEAEKLREKLSLFKFD